MGKDENIRIFQDTTRLCENNERLKKQVKESTMKQKLILENDLLPEHDINVYESPAEVVVSKKRTFDAASNYKNQKVCVHNFASATNPGGGVVNGSTAQEECLCRCSGLYFSLNDKRMRDGFYQPHRRAKNPIHNDDIIYTPDVTVFKTDNNNPKLMAEKDWYDVNVITCAAPNLRKKPSNSHNSGDGDKAVKVSAKELLSIHEKRLRRILDVAVREKNEVVILGAFGCGAFYNSPEVVAQAARNVVKEYLYAFKTIEFAVFCRKGDELNYRVFERVLK